MFKRKKKYFQCYYLSTTILTNNKKQKSKISHKVYANPDDIVSIYNNCHVYKVNASIDLTTIIPLYRFITFEIIDVDDEIIKKTQYFSNSVINSILYLKKGKKHNYKDYYAVSIYDMNGNLTCQESYNEGVLHNDNLIPSMVIYNKGKVKELRYYRNGSLTTEFGQSVVKF